MRGGLLLCTSAAALDQGRAFAGPAAAAFMQRKLSTPTSLRLFEEYMSEDFMPKGPKEDEDDGDEMMSYGLGGVDLSTRWEELVAGGHVAASTQLTNDDDSEGLLVRYGVRLEEEGSRLLEFAEIAPGQEDSAAALRDHALSINATLAELQSKDAGMAMECVYDGPYAIQLQLVRTLRPPRSKEMLGSNGDAEERSSCRPPPYDATKDSFLVGPLRLFGEAGEFHGEGEPRERAARVSVPRDGSKNWDVFHNISPVDPRGHFLLLPNVADECQWRDQSLTPDDCHDLTRLASTVAPKGSMAISFNSVSAGASQNHVHAHAWPNPPPPLRHRRDPTAEYDSVYAATKATALASINLPKGATVSLLKYACTCVKLSASVPEEDAGPALEELEGAISKVVDVAARKMRVPHNVVWMNGVGPSGRHIVDAYVFFRKAETVDVQPKNTQVERGTAFRMGASEMMGVFHASSREELFAVKKHRGLSCYGCVNVLSDISYEPRQHVWAEVSSALGKKKNRRLAALQRAELHKKEKKSGDGGNETGSGYQYLRTGVPYE
ncbi:hypothetical protein ACHAXT_003409 [Thalassiosira profunda]